MVLKLFGKSWANLAVFVGCFLVVMGYIVDVLVASWAIIGLFWWFRVVRLGGTRCDSLGRLGVCF